MRISDWSSDVCSSDLLVRMLHGQPAVVAVACVGVDAEAELADVEVVGFVLVADVQADDQAGDGDVVCQRAVVHGSSFVLGAPTVSRSEEQTSELQSLMRTSFAVFCLKQKKPMHA